MDAGQRTCSKRVCFTYILTFLVLVVFFYHLMWNNRKSIDGLLRLQQDVNCLSQKLKVDCSGEMYSSMPLSRPEDGQGSALSCDSVELNTCVDTLIKRKLGTVMDDVYNLKKQWKESGCMGKQPASASPTQAALYLPPTRINYASEDLGARITHAMATPIGETNFFKTLLGLEFSANPPVNMLRPSILPGACFGFRGAEATVFLRLAKVIIVEEICMTHVSKEMTPSSCVDNAPKDFEVHGLPSDRSEKQLLGSWVYANDPKKRSQNFIVKNNGVFRTLVFTFSSNHGGNSTCIYRVEVYGRLP